MREHRRLTAHEALRRIRILALDERGRVGAKNARNRTLDEIVAIADAVLRTTPV